MIIFGSPRATHHNGRPERDKVPKSAPLMPGARELNLLGQIHGSVRPADWTTSPPFARPAGGVLVASMRRLARSDRRAHAYGANCTPESSGNLTHSTTTIHSGRLRFDCLEHNVASAGGAGSARFRALVLVAAARENRVMESRGHCRALSPR
jgi:hypothetical protein